MIIASASFAANDINTKIAVEFLPVTEIIVIRGVTASIFAFSMACFVHGVSQLKTIANRNLFWRSLFEASVGPILITCYAFLPLATVTAVMQFGPFIGMIAGIYLFKETVGWRRWCAAAVAFLGVLLIIKPGSEAFQPIVIPVLFAATLGVARDIQSRKIGNTVPPFVVPLATSLMSILIASALNHIVEQHLNSVYIEANGDADLVERRQALTRRMAIGEQVLKELRIKLGQNHFYS